MVRDQEEAKYYAPSICKVTFQNIIMSSSLQIFDNNGNYGRG